MFSFRQKIFITYLIVFFIFIVGMYPFANQAVKKLSIKAMRDRATELIEKIQSAPNNDALIRRLKEQKALIFFRVSVITDERKVLYDSHTKRLLGPRFSQDYMIDHPEVMEAFERGTGYHEEYSELLGQKFSYFAKTFDFHGKTYVIRTAFPYKYVMELSRDFEVGIIALATAILLLFSIMTWFVINHLTSPIQQIINAVKPYQEGIETTVPEIILKSGNSTDEFAKLADTLNSLSKRIQKHINAITDERNEKEAILESLGEGVIAIDDHMIVRYANNMAIKILGMEKADLIGHNFSVTNQNKFYHLLTTCQQENKILTDHLHIKGDGRNLYLDIIAAPKKANAGAILVLQDKSPHYKLLEMRKDFIANASHELKTPITIIRGFAETLHDNPDLPRNLFHEVTEKIVRNCVRMANLIKDLLILTDVENIPEFRLIECNLEEIILNCCQMVQDIHPDAQISMNKPEGIEMLMTADPNLMELAFLNLIENAAKYSNPPAQITIDMAINGNVLEVRISDKGIGIPPADLEHIFQRFYTVDKAHSRKMGGSGLGLSIVETIIEKHNGRISVESEQGKGTTFTIHLPIVA